MAWSPWQVWVVAAALSLAALRWGLGLRQRVQRAEGELAQTHEALRQARDEVERCRQSLQSSARRGLQYEQIMTHLNDGVWMLDPADGRVRYVSPSVERLWGYTAAEAAAMALDEFLAPASLPVVNAMLARYRKSLAGNECLPASELELELRCKDGTLRWCNWTLMGIHDPAGLLLSVLCIARDITQERMANLKILHASRRLELAVEASDVAIWSWDVETNAMEWDERMCRWYELPENRDRSRIVFNDWFCRLDPDDAQRAFGVIQKALEKKDRFYRDMFRIVRSVNSPMYLEVVAEILYADDGRPIQMVGTNRDVTQARMTAIGLFEAKEQAEAANRAKSDFLANMSHEIRTPLNGIMGMIDFMLDAPVSSEQQESLELIRRSADSLQKIIGDVLDISRIESGKIVVEVGTFSLRTLLESIRDSMQLEAIKKKLGLDLNLFPDIPPMLLGDSQRIQQVLLNLVANAIKFTERGAVVITVRPVKRADDVLTLQFDVQDSGIGIAPDKQQLIFEPFVQADASTTRRYGGSGLGLTIARRLIELMGGRMWLDSIPGLGSTFHFTVDFLLPVAEDEADGDRLASQDAQATPVEASASDGTGSSILKVLAVDDNPINQVVVQKWLRRWNYAVSLAGDGQEALNLMAIRKFDCVLMDVQMPIMGGLEAARLIRYREQVEGLPRTPIIAVTANAQHSNREACLESGMDAFMTKPMQPHALKKVIEELVS